MEFDLVPQSSKWLSGFVMDQQLSYRYDTQLPKNKNPILAHDTKIAGEFLGFETTWSTNNDNTGQSNSLFVMTRKDPKGKALGLKALNTKELVLNDVYFKSVPLVTSPLNGQGVTASSYDLLQSNNFGSHDFHGLLQENWEVELYHEDTLIGRKLSDGSGRYEFNDIPLFYSQNRFRLTFYGPHGEQYDEYYEYNINPKMNQKNQFQYFLGYSQNKEKKNQYLAQLDYGLTQNLTLRGHLLGVPPEFQNSTNENLEEQYQVYSLLGFWGPISYSLSTALSENYGQAYEPQLQYRASSFNLSLTHRKFDQFKSLLFNKEPGDPLLEYQNEYSLTFITPLHPIRLTFDFFEDRYKNSDPTYRLKNFLNTYFWGLHWNHLMEFQEGSLDQYKGHFESTYSKPSRRVSLAADYNQEDLQKVSLSGRKYFSKKYNLQAEWSHLFQDKLDILSLSSAYFFKHFSISLALSADTHKEYSIYSILSYSLGKDEDHHLHMQNESLTSQGAFVAQVFKDQNHNGQWDLGVDTPLPGVNLIINDQTYKVKSDNQGRIFQSQLPTYRYLNVKVSFSGIEDPLLQPLLPGQTLLLKPGQIPTLTMALVAKSEIDGFVTNKKDQPLKGVTVELIPSHANGPKSVKTITDEEGYYLFEKISPGAYTIQIQPQSNQNSQTPPAILIEVSSDGDFYNDQNFILESNSP